MLVTVLGTVPQGGEDPSPRGLEDLSPQLEAQGFAAAGMGGEERPRRCLSGPQDSCCPSKLFLGPPDCTGRISLFPQLPRLEANLGGSSLSRVSR